MSYIQTARDHRKALRGAQAVGQFSGPLAYIVFSVAFIFTAAIVLGLIP